MKQRSFASAVFAIRLKRSRRKEFLAAIEQALPRQQPVALIGALYPNIGWVAQQSMGVSKMLRTCLLQQWYVLANEALEDAIYHFHARRDFVGIDLNRESAPDGTTLLKLRHQVVTNDLTEALFEKVNARPANVDPVHPFPLRRQQHRCALLNQERQPRA